MSPKRGDRVAPPSVKGEWEVKFGTSDSAKGWDELCVQAKVNTREAFELMRSSPRPPQDGSHYRLKGDLGIRSYGGQDLEQWQIKVSGSGRIWYLPDDSKHTVWIVYAGMAHPKATE